MAMMMIMKIMKTTLRINNNNIIIKLTQTNNININHKILFIKTRVISMINQSMIKIIHLIMIIITTNKNN